MTSANDLTVVVTCFNHRMFVRQTLESVWRQSLQPAEIIVVDDASEDGSGDLLERLSRKSPVPMSVVRRRHNSGGPALPTNVGIGAAQTTWVATLEGDDPCVEGRLEAEYRATQL